jgi:hypothetical protein
MGNFGNDEGTLPRTQKLVSPGGILDAAENKISNLKCAGLNVFVIMPAHTL